MVIQSNVKKKLTEFETVETPPSLVGQFMATISFYKKLFLVYSLHFLSIFDEAKHAFLECIFLSNKFCEPLIKQRKQVMSHF
jgi:hypothetical protein